MAVFVIGARGYIGSRLVPAASGLGTVNCTSASPASGMLQLELSRPLDFDYGRVSKGDVIYLTGGISAPDECAVHPERARAVNVDGSTAFIECAIARGARVIFFSSDAVYGHSETEVDEVSPANPAGAYAQMKYEVERRFVSSTSFKALRLSYVFSRADRFTRYLLDCARRGTEAEVFAPLMRAAIHLDDVVAAAVALASRWDSVPSAVNFGGPALLGREDIAAVVRRAAAPSLSYRLKAPSAEFLENRPAVINMRSPWLETLLGRPARSLADAAALEFELP